MGTAILHRLITIVFSIVSVCRRQMRTREKSFKPQFVYTALLVFALDQMSKLIVLKKLVLGSSVSLGMFSITHVTNTGITWGLLKSMPWIPFIVSLLVIVGIVVYYKQIPHERGYQIIAGLVLAG